MFKFFLVSSQVHLEKNALSEAAGILSNYINIEKITAKLLPVGGLGLLQLDNEIEISESIDEIVDDYVLKEKVYYCYRIIPLEYFAINGEETILEWIENNKSRISEFESWKVLLNKRHSSLKTREIINKVAAKISVPVDLKNPKILFIIEIIGKFVGLAILKPFQIIQLSNKITLEEKKDDLADDMYEFN